MASVKASLPQMEDNEWDGRFWDTNYLSKVKVKREGFDDQPRIIYQRIEESQRMYGLIAPCKQNRQRRGSIYIRSVT